MSEETSTEATPEPADQAPPNTSTTMMLDAPQTMAQTAQAEPAPEQDVQRISEIDKSSDAVEAQPDISALEAQIQALQEAQKQSASTLEKHEQAMRDTLLSKLGVLEKYRQFAPTVDPFSDEGRAALEQWAQNNVELLEARPSAVPEVDLDQFKSKMRSPHLVDLASFNKSMRKS